MVLIAIVSQTFLRLRVKTFFELKKCSDADWEMMMLARFLGWKKLKLVRLFFDSLMKPPAIYCWLRWAGRSFNWNGLNWIFLHSAKLIYGIDNALCLFWRVQSFLLIKNIQEMLNLSYKSVKLKNAKFMIELASRDWKSFNFRKLLECVWCHLTLTLI